MPLRPRPRHRLRRLSATRASPEHPVVRSRDRPPLPASGTTLKEHTMSTSPATWHPDPTGRHHLRYFNGDQWTDHDTTQAGEQTLDQLQPVVTSPVNKLDAFRIGGVGIALML